MTRPTFIYVVEARIGLIKIGVSASPFGRAETIHSHSPVPCRLIATWSGTQEEEARLHHAFAAYRSHCEWFRIEGAVADFVSFVRRTGVETIPEWESLAFGDVLARRAAAGRKRAEKLRAKWADPEYRAEQARARAIYREHRQRKAAEADRGRAA